MDVCLLRVLWGRGLCDELIIRHEESYRLWCVVVCDLETSRMRRPWPAWGRSATAKKKLNEDSAFCVARTKTYDVNDKLYVQAREVPYAHERYLFGGGEVMQTNESIWPHDMRTDRSRWPCGLRRGSAVAPLLVSRVRIPPGAGMSVSCECSVFSGRGLCVELIPRTEESYRMCTCQRVISRNNNHLRLQ